MPRPKTETVGGEYGMRCSGGKVGSFLVTGRERPQNRTPRGQGQLLSASASSAHPRA